MPLTRAHVRIIRSLYLLYPVVAVVMIATVGVPAGRAVAATVFFGCCLATHALALSRPARWQVVGLRRLAAGGRS